MYLQPAVQKVGTSFEWFPDLGAFRDFRRATERICSMRFADDRALLGDSDEGALSALQAEVEGLKGRLKQELAAGGIDEVKLPI